MALLGYWLRQTGLGWPSGRFLSHAAWTGPDNWSWVGSIKLQWRFCCHSKPRARPFPAQTTTKGHLNTTYYHQTSGSTYGYRWAMDGQVIHHGSVGTISHAGDKQIHLISIAPSHPPDIHATHTYLGSFACTGIFSGCYLEGKAMWEGTGR